jgi:hypothetical protein
MPGMILSQMGRQTRKDKLYLIEKTQNNRNFVLL